MRPREIFAKSAQASQAHSRVSPQSHSLTASPFLSNTKILGSFDEAEHIIADCVPSHHCTHCLQGYPGVHFVLC